jgi:hypothetical protein
LKKNYCVGGMATRQKDMLPEVGKSIAEALKKQQIN